MFCSNCGATLDANARFCRQCGDPQQQADAPAATRLLGSSPLAAATNEGGGELCASEHEILEPGGLLTKTQARYWARATGPRGTYSAGKTPPLQYRYSRAVGVFISPLGAR